MRAKRVLGEERGGYCTVGEMTRKITNRIAEVEDLVYKYLSHGTNIRKYEW